MARKVFCDACGREKTDDAAMEPTIQFKPGAASGTQPIAVPRVKGHDVCKYCIIDAFIRLDDRPKSQDQAQPHKAKP